MSPPVSLPLAPRLELPLRRDLTDVFAEDLHAVLAGLVGAGVEGEDGNGREVRRRKRERTRHVHGAGPGEHEGGADRARNLERILAVARAALDYFDGRDGVAASLNVGRCLPRLAGTDGRFAALEIAHQNGFTGRERLSLLLHRGTLRFEASEVTRAVDEDTRLPDGFDVAAVEDLLVGVAVHEYQVGERALGDDAAVADVE